MTARKTCHYYKKTKCGSTTDNNEPIVVLPDHCDPKINNTVQKFSYFMALKMSKLKRSYDLTLVYNRNHYFGLGLIPKPNPRLADTFGRYRN